MHHSNTIEVLVKDSLQNAIRILKRKAQRDGRFAEFRRRKEFSSPAHIRKLKKIEVANTIRKRQKELNERFN